MRAVQASGVDAGAAVGFEQFFRAVEPRLRRALSASLGPELGREAAAAALAWAWEHRDRLGELSYPLGYLYRVGRSSVRRRRFRPLHAPVEWREPWVEPGLSSALRELSEHQRVAVVLIHGYQWTQSEVAELLDVSTSTVQTHLERALSRLRWHLEANQ